MGIFSGGYDRSIVQDSSFFDSMAPTQGDNDAAITVATEALQYSASLYSEGWVILLSPGVGWYIMGYESEPLPN